MSYGPDGPKGQDQQGYTAGATGACGDTGATGPAGGIGSTGHTGFGFGFSGQTTNLQSWQFVEINDDNDTLTFILGGSAGSQLAGRDTSLSISGLRGPTGTTGENGRLVISNLVTGASGALILRGISGPSADFKTINSRSDVTISVSNDTIILSGVSANSADSVDAGRTGEVLVMVKENYADGATGTFFNLSSYPTANTSNNASLDTLSVQKIGNQREIIKRHGTPATPVGFGSSSREDITIDYNDSNVHLIHCGPTTGYINFPDPIEVESIGDTYGRSQELTIIVQSGSKHGLIAGDQPNDFCQSTFRPSVVNFAIFNGLRQNIFDIGGSELPFCDVLGDNSTASNLPCRTVANQNVAGLLCSTLTTDYANGTTDAGQRTNVEGDEDGVFAVYYREGTSTATGTVLLKDLKLSDGYDIFTFTLVQRRWVLNNPTLGITADSRYSLSKTNTGSCCSYNAAGDYLNCDDYVLESSCTPELLGPEVASIKFTPFTLCELSGCEGPNDGACCTMGTCVQSDRETCNTFSGFFVPNAICGQGGLDCNDYPCDSPVLPTGSCCLVDADGCNSCVDVTEDQCAVLGGNFGGYDTTCSMDPCPENPPDSDCKYGACCSFNALNPGIRQCGEVTERTCNDSLSGLYYGDDTKCCTTLYPRDGIYIGAYCDGTTVQIIYGTSTEDVEGQIPEDVDPLCKNIILWNTNTPYPQSWVPGFATQDFLDPNGNQIHLPSVSRLVCQFAEQGLCGNCNCLSQAVENRDNILGTCCLPYRIPVEGVGENNITCDYIPNYDQQTCIQVGGDWRPQTPDELGLDCAAGLDCNPGSQSEDPGCVDCDIKGACCFGGNCEYLSGDECDALGGEFQGEGTNCDIVECCDLITGPCCLNDGTCIETHPYNCNQLGGVFNGIGLSCDDESFNCCTHQDVDDVRGACCCEGCPCSENETAASCQARNGVDGCSDCVFYRDQGCFDIPCIDYQCTDECLIQEPDRVSWYVFTLGIDGVTPFNNGPYSWGNTNFNPNATLPEEVDYLPPITRPQDGFYNSHGWYWSWGTEDDDSFATCEWNTPGSANESDSTIMRKSGPLTYSGFSSTNSDSVWKDVLDKYWDDDTNHAAVRETNYGVASGGLVQPIATLENNTSAPVTIWEILRQVNVAYSPQNATIYQPAGHIDSTYIHPIMQQENLYIPSKQELHFFYYQREAYQGLRNATNYVQGNVWTSSVAHDDSTYAFYQNMDNGEVGVHKVLDIKNPSNSWPNTDHISVNSSSIFLYRIMKGSQEYKDLTESYLESLVPGDSVTVGTTKTRGMVFVGKFAPGCNQVFGTSSNNIAQFLDVNDRIEGEQVCSNKLPEGSCCDCEGCSDISASQYTCLHRRNGEVWPDSPELSIKQARVKRWKSDRLDAERVVQYIDSSNNVVTQRVRNVTCETDMNTSDNLYPFFWSCDNINEQNSSARNYYDNCLEKGVCCNPLDLENPTFVPQCQCQPPNTWYDTNGQSNPATDSQEYCGFTPEVTSTCCQNETPGGPITICTPNVAQANCTPLVAGGIAQWGGPNEEANLLCTDVNCIEIKGSCCFGLDADDNGSFEDYVCADNNEQGYYIGECQDSTSRNAILESLGVTPQSRRDQYDLYSFNAVDGGNYRCANNPCPQDTIGRCCKYDASGQPIDNNGDNFVDCEETDFLSCIDENGGANSNQWTVGNCNGNPCGPMPGPTEGACCEVDSNNNQTGNCSQTTPTNCTGQFQGLGVPCVDVNGDPICVAPPPPPPATANCCDDNDDGIPDYVCVDIPSNPQNDNDSDSTWQTSSCGLSSPGGINLTRTVFEDSDFGIYAQKIDAAGNYRRLTPEIATYGCPCSWFDINAFPDPATGFGRYGPDYDVWNDKRNITYTAHSPSDCMWIKNHLGVPPDMENSGNLEGAYYEASLGGNYDSNACQLNCCEGGKYGLSNLGQSINDFSQAGSEKKVMSSGYQYTNNLPLRELIPTNSQSSYYRVDDTSPYLYQTTNQEDELATHNTRVAHWDYNIIGGQGGFGSTHNTLKTWNFSASVPPSKAANNNELTLRTNHTSYLSGYPLGGGDAGFDLYNLGGWANSSYPLDEKLYGYHAYRNSDTRSDLLDDNGLPRGVASRKLKGIHGPSTNRFAHVCVPYKGLFNIDGENWWTGTNTQNYQWELPAQTDVDTLALNPSMARKVSFTYQTYEVYDRFQIVQLPWPKGARTKEEAQERIELYLRAINASIYLTPMKMGEEGLNTWTDAFGVVGSESPETTQRRRNQEDPLAILQDPFSSVNGLNRDATLPYGRARLGTFDYLNGLVFTNRPYSRGTGADSRAFNSIISSERVKPAGGAAPAPDGSRMLYHGREKSVDGPETRALSIAEKYLGYPASQDWVMFDSGCVSTLQGIRRDGGFPNGTDPIGVILSTTSNGQVYQSCATLTFPYCPLRLDSKQVSTHAFYNSAESVESIIQRRMTQGYGPGGQGPISPIVIGISGCDTETWQNTDWDDWVRDNAAGSVYTVRMNSCGGGSISMIGSGDRSATGLPEGSLDGVDKNQTNCGKHVFTKTQTPTETMGDILGPQNSACANGC